VGISCIPVLWNQRRTFSFNQRTHLRINSRWPQNNRAAWRDKPTTECWQTAVTLLQRQNNFCRFPNTSLRLVAKRNASKWSKQQVHKICPGLCGGNMRRNTCSPAAKSYALWVSIIILKMRHQSIPFPFHLSLSFHFALGGLFLFDGFSSLLFSFSFNFSLPFQLSFQLLLPLSFLLQSECKGNVSNPLSFWRKSESDAGSRTQGWYLQQNPATAIVVASPALHELGPIEITPHQARNQRGAQGASPPWKNVLDTV